jgi:hypothetical protein
MCIEFAFAYKEIRDLTFYLPFFVLECGYPFYDRETNSSQSPEDDHSRGEI